MKRLLLMAAAALALTACNDTEVVREIGYKGKARLNPWLAAERFVARLDWQVHSVIAWTPPAWDDAVWIMPASILSNASFCRRMDEWVRDGGHLILLVEHADEAANDWAGDAAPPVLEPALLAMLRRARITLKPAVPNSGSTTAENKVEFGGRTFAVDGSSDCSVAPAGGKPGVLASVAAGIGRITVVTDGRLFRNRWIDGHEHAGLLEALVAATNNRARVGFMRGAGLSLWALLRQHLGPVLLAGGLWLVLWLWKNLSRFGPLEAAAAPPVLRGYEHHLAALGAFQWRVDRAASLLAPLRRQIIELAQRPGLHGERAGGDVYQLLADRSGLPRDRVARALAETRPADPASLTRSAADLQQLASILHHPSQP